MASEDLVSVGIDIGTTTTLVMFSKLTVAETASFGAMPQARYGPARKPRADIMRKEVLYQGPTHFTPITDEGLVDVEALKLILAEEYERGGFRPEEVDTGAVIITGESAKKRNAERVLEIVAPIAGDFVSTVAGPSLEAHLAGRGSGAAAWSAEHFASAVNVDIGGGTTNIAVFRQGELIGTAVLSVGGRHVQVDRETGAVRLVTRSGRKLLDHLGLRLEKGEAAELGGLRRLARLMADLVFEALDAKASAIALEVMETPPLAEPASGMTVFFSGGVADFFYDDAPIASIRDMAVYGDMGPLLGEELRSHPRARELRILKPAHTECATVMGASRETITLSGMTIWVDANGDLPIRNVPVVGPRLAGGEDEAGVAALIAEGYARWDLDPARDRAAIALDLSSVSCYDDLKRVAAGVAAFARARCSPELPLILATERDLGKALGQLLDGMLHGFKVLSIDEVSLSEGDYVDIGQSMLGDRLVSLSVKTLIFNS
ncbi:MAG TPA: ethanolamine ammonia-lyase reactivating factor EutA [Spirochaetales bacterium]|nr:ethanolamine ammonia-lyase reactivating factor EutA [Spirochaetales bacterium]HRY53390.1 ethanolamine ammonia-lyase reactivating factor EutA [Spirochaetia bacterium]HRZ63979.1 ethanolamine ammonia-lyase reactivating factor EutA [Spirochaetia bacterium]